MKKKEAASIKIDPGKAAEVAYDFQIGLAQARLSGNPDDFAALEMLANALTRRGRHHEALTIDLRLASLLPDDAAVRYNLACSLSNVGDLDAALAELERAVGLGYNDIRFMSRDPDLLNVRNDPRFKQLLETKARRRQRR